MDEELITAMKKLITEREITGYISGMIWKMFMKGKDAGMHRKYFDDGRLAIIRVTKRLIEEDYQPKHIVENKRYVSGYHPVSILRDNWFLPLYKLAGTTILRREEYDVSEGVCQLKYWKEVRDENYTLIEESLMIFTGWKETVDTGYGGSEMVIYFDREIYPSGNSSRQMHTAIIEYDDYYEEQQRGYEYRKETKMEIWKHDLFRDELHTIPFKAIHEEMLYSLDTPLWYQNQARQAQRHFESITHNSVKSHIITI